MRDCRFTDLRSGLPGIATNLLTERLRALEAAGVVERFAAPPPVATTLYRLTSRGRALEPVVRELTRWGMAEMVRGLDAGDATRAHWIAGAVPLMYEGADLRGIGPLAVDVEAGDQRLRVTVDAAGSLRAEPGQNAAAADVVVRADGASRHPGPHVRAYCSDRTGATTVLITGARPQAGDPRYGAAMVGTVLRRRPCEGEEAA